MKDPLILVKYDKKTLNCADRLLSGNERSKARKCKKIVFFFTRTSRTRKKKIIK